SGQGSLRPQTGRQPGRDRMAGSHGHASRQSDLSPALSNGRMGERGVPQPTALADARARATQMPHRGHTACDYSQLALGSKTARRGGGGRMKRMTLGKEAKFGKKLVNGSLP